MPRVRFNGRVLPAAQIIELIQIPEIKIADSSTGIEGIYTLKIEKSIIEIDCDANQELTDEVRYALIAYANYLARLIIDLVSFRTGQGFLVLLDMMTDEGQSPQVMHYRHYNVAPLATSLGENMVPVIAVFMREMGAMEALRDLTDSITNPFRGRISVTRAVETIRHLIDPNPNRMASWASMRASLNLSQPYLTYISERSVNPRHGNHDGTTRDEADEITKRGWTVMNRFIELRKRAVQSLPIAEFPEL